MGPPIAIALGISPLLTFAVIGCGGTVAAILVSWRRGAPIRPECGQRRRIAPTFDQISDFAASIKLAKSHNAEERHRMAFEAALARQNDSVFAVYRHAADAQLLVQVATAVTLSAFIYVGAEFVHLSAPELVVMIVVFARLMPGLMGLQQNVHSVLLMLPVFDDLQRLIARCQTAKEPLGTGGTDLLRLFDKIELSGIRFRYDKKRGPNVLDGVELEIPAGSVVAIVGTSGAGKSTIADLVMGLQVPDAGNLTVDGQALTGPRLAAWRRSVAYIPQESFLFHQSIRANLLWSAPAASDADLHRVLALTAPMSSSQTCRMDSIRWSASAAPGCPAASASGSSSLARSCATRPCWSSTKQQALSTTKANGRCGP
jgi:ATP-binding cassette subfamily C protein